MRFGSLDRMVSDSASSSSRALMADELDSSESRLGLVWRSWEACLRASRTFRTGGVPCFGESAMAMAVFFFLVGDGKLKIVQIEKLFRFLSQF